MSGLTDEEANSCCSEPDESCKDFIMQQTMYRIKDPKRSLKFYTNVLGMRLLRKFDFPAMKFSLYFMGYAKKEDIPTDIAEATKWLFLQPATVELTHNWGTEKEEGETYHNGNKEPRGFGHIGISVPDVYKACERFEKLGVTFVKKPDDACERFVKLGVTFVKKPDDGKMKGLAFIQDPDGYWIEILSAINMSQKHSA